MSEHSGGREQSEQSGASKRVSGASKQANGQVSGSVLMSLFLFVPDHSEAASCSVALRSVMSFLMTSFSVSSVSRKAGFVDPDRSTMSLMPQLSDGAGRQPTGKKNP